MTVLNLTTLHEYRRLLMLSGAVLGGLLGYLAWIFVLSFSQSTFIVSIGQVGQGSLSGAVGQQVKLEQVFLEDPSAFIERVRSPAFAASIAARIGKPEFIETLPALQYGGRGRLTARSIRPPNLGPANLVEVRISSFDPDLAQAAAQAAVDQILQEHSKLLEPFLDAMKTRQAFLNSQSLSSRKMNEEISRKMGDGTDISDVSKAISVGAKLLGSKSTLDLELTGYDAMIGLLTQDFRKTLVLFEPATARPRVVWVVAGPLSGAIAGFIFAFLALRIAREVAQRRGSPPSPIA